MVEMTRRAGLIGFMPGQLQVVQFLRPAATSIHAAIQLTTYKYDIVLHRISSPLPGRSRGLEALTTLIGLVPDLPVT